MTTFTYDLLDRRTSAAIGGTRVSSTTFNTLGWPLSETDPDGVVTTWTYDREGRTLSRTVTAGGLSATTTHAFDNLGREVESSDPSSASVESTFDAFGRATRRIERTSDGALAHDVTSSFDAMGRTLRSVDAAVETTTSFTYAQDPSGTSTITREVGGTTLTVTTSAQGREISRMLTYTGSVATTLETEVSSDCRDAAGRPQVWVIAGPGGTAVRCDARNASGSLQVQLGCGTHNDYAYEPSTGRLNEEALAVSGAPSRTTTFSYTAEGRLAASTLQGSGTTAYSYDAAGQITQAGSALFTYGNGHLATMLEGSATTTFTFDARQRRVSEVSTDESRTLSWDAADRLTGVAIDRGRNGSVDVTASFTYDASGMRVGSVVTSGGVTATSTYVWNGLALERVRSVCGTATTVFSYLFDEQSRPLAIGMSVPETTTPYLLPLSVTARGDVSAVVDFSQNGVAAWRYTPYGRPDGNFTSSSAQVPASVAARLATQPLRYAGYLFDEYSGYYCCGARYYDPKTCQFLSRDPAGADGQESAYQYCGGDPVGRVDPSGAVTVASGGSGSFMAMRLETWPGYRYRYIGVSPSGASVFGFHVYRCQVGDFQACSANPFVLRLRRAIFGYAVAQGCLLGYATTTLLLQVTGTSKPTGDLSKLANDNLISLFGSAASARLLDDSHMYAVRDSLTRSARNSAKSAALWEEEHRHLQYRFGPLNYGPHRMRQR